MTGLYSRAHQVHSDPSKLSVRKQSVGGLIVYVIDDGTSVIVMNEEVAALLSGKLIDALDFGEADQWGS